MTYTADPELAALQHLLPRADLSDLAGTRALERRSRNAYEPARPLTTDKIVVPGDVRVRVFAPAGRGGPLPGLIYLRASGFVLGSLDSADAPAQHLADQLDVAVITVDYRLAPEHPYPAALDDSTAALEWATSAAAASYGIDPSRVGVLGDSAGGGIAAGLAMRWAGPPITALFLDAPTIDDRCDTPSMREFTDTPMWRSPDSPITWRHYLGGRTDVPIYAAPARATVADLAALPPTWIAAYQLDPTRDEALAFAGRLAQAGVPTDLCLHAGAFHLAHAIPGTAIGARILAGKYAAIERMLVRGPQAEAS